MVDPLGIEGTPLFSWVITGGGIGGAQSAYEIFVATTAQKAADGIGDIWDSGKILSGQNYDIAYDGAALSSRTDYYWAVQVWDETGSSLGISQPAHFHTGMFSTTEWQGQWIGFPQSDEEKMTLEGASWIWSGNSDTTSAAIQKGGTIYLRKTFTVTDPAAVTWARIAWTADDQSEMYYNGTLLGTTPSWTAGGMAEITELVQAGTNCIAMAATNIADGYGGAIARLILDFSDGHREEILTDQTWKVCSEEVSGWQEISCTNGSWGSPLQQVPYGADPWQTNLNLSDINNPTRSAVNLRKEFAVEKPVASAYAYICGLGFFTLTVNGQEVTDSVMNPSPSQYDYTSLYCVYDVTALLEQGDNALGVELGNSFFNETGGVWNWPNASWRDNPKCLLNLELCYADGSKETVVTDGSWKVTRNGPITNNSIYYGDCYDARKALVDTNGIGFDEAGYEDSDWLDAFLMQAPTNPDTGAPAQLVWQQEEPCVRTAVYKPKSIQQLDEDSWAITCPAMTTGWAKLFGIQVPAGQEVTITYSEKQHEDGTVMKLGGADGEGENWWSDANICQDHYISDGSANASYEPRYSYKGFAYIQIDGWQGEFTADNIEIYRINNGMASIGTLETSSETVNALQQMMRTSIENNVQGRPTDCPVYEKNGWTGDCNVAVDTILYNYDAKNVMENFLNMLADTQDAFGNVADIAPSANSFTDNHPTWNTIFLFGATDMCEYYGNYSYVETMYEDLRTFAMTDINIIKGQGWLWPGGSYGDWCSPYTYGNGDSPCAAGASEGSKITDNAMLYGALTELTEVTQTLYDRAIAAGDTQLAGQYEADLTIYRNATAQMYTAFNNRFYNAQKGYYETGEWSQTGDRTVYRQTSQAAALAFGLVPEQYAAAVAKGLAEDVIAKDYHLDTGVVGTRVLLPVLTQYGYDDVAFRVATQMTYPSWGYWLSLGATSCWEQWETSSRSLNHYMFASLGEWFYSGIAGIRDIQNGYETFTIDPVFTSNLNYANCTIDTVRGPLTSNWKRNQDGTVTLELVIPYGSQATVSLPTARRHGSATVNGKAPSSAEGVLSAGVPEDQLCLTLTSGSYTIISDTDTLELYRFSLEDAIAQAEALELDLYPEAQKDQLMEALLQAKQLYQAESGVTQMQLNDAEALLTQRIVTIQGTQARQDLYAALAAYGKADTADRNPTLAAAYQSAVLTATMLAQDLTTADEQLQTAAANLTAAWRVMVEGAMENLALGKTCTASSSEESPYWGWSLDFITDGDTQNINQGGEYAGYSSADQTDASHVEWICTDLGETTAFHKYVLYPSCTSYNGVLTGFGAPKAYEIQVSDDGATWHTVYSGSLEEAPGSDPVTAEFDTVEARYVRLYATELFQKRSEGQIFRLQLTEIQIYAQPVVTEQPEGLTYVQLSNGTLDPVFSYFTRAYTATVAHTVDSITVTPYATEGTDITVNGKAVASGRTSAAIPLEQGENLITLTAGGATTTVTVTREAPAFLMGDMNGDGTLSVTDVVLLRKAILNGTFAQEGDLNQDLALSVTDVVLLRKAILGQA